MAFLGFWLLLIGAPDLAARAGDADWVAGIAIGAVLLAWNHFHPDVVRFFLRAKPVIDDGMAARLASLAARSDVRDPRFDIVPMRGGVLANAVALPSLRRPSVLMSSTFIERFDADEIVAVCAHELAHLEHYSGTRLQRLYLGTIALIVAGVLVEPVARIVAPAAAPWASISWVVFVFSFQAMRARSKQQNETASDVRAVALTGEGESLVRALVKLHTMARVPRRWDAQFERHATHPSLARRIKAIREAAGHPVERLETVETFQSGSTSIAFEHERLHWSDADLSHSVGYARLTELRLVLSRARTPQLLAVDRTGQRWMFPLDPADVSRAQRALDAVDCQLAAAPAPPTVSAAAVRLISAVTAVVAVSASQLAVLVPLVLAMARPSAALAAGAAAGALASAVVLWRDGASASLGIASMLENGWLGWSVTLVLCSGALLGFAWFGRKDDDSQPLTRSLAVLSLGTLLAWIALFLSGTSVARLHQSAHASPAGIVFPVALAVALAWDRRGALRRAATPIGLIAAIVFAIGSRTYLESFSADRFLGEGPPLSVSEVDGPARSEASVERFAGTVRLSPSGRFIAIGSDGDDEPRVFHVGQAEGPFERIECDSLFFVDDRLLLTITHLRDGALLREIEIAAGFPVVRERRIEHVAAARVAFDQATGTWTLLGTGTDEDVVRIEGHVGGREDDVVRRWPGIARDAGRNGWVQPVAASGENVLMQRSRYHASLFGYGYVAALMYAFSPTWIESDFWTAGASGSRQLGTSGLNVDCRPAFASVRPVCAAFDGSRTTLFAIDLGSGELDARTTMRGRFIASEDDGSGWVGGFLGGHAMVVRADGAEALRVASREGEWIRAVAANNGTIAALVSRGAGQVVRTYPTPSASVTGTTPRRR